MSAAAATIIANRRHIWVDEEQAESVAIGPAFVARADCNGMLIPESRLSKDFTSWVEAFDICANLQRQYPDAAVFENTWKLSHVTTEVDSALVRVA